MLTIVLFRIDFSKKKKKKKKKKEKELGTREGHRRIFFSCLKNEALLSALIKKLFKKEGFQFRLEDVHAVTIATPSDG